MSRHGLNDEGGDDDQWAFIRWRGAVASAIGGKRGQAALREIASALDAMPVKELAAQSLVTTDGMCCTLGALGQARGLDMTGLDPEDREAVARAFGIAEAMAAEIMYFNDETISDFDYVDDPDDPSPESAAAKQRWRYMRNWVDKQLKSATSAKDGA